MVVGDLRRRAAVLVALAAAGCAVPYRACPVELPGPVPADAFARCRQALLARYGELAFAEPDPLRLQTDWVEVDELPGERRISVYADGAELSVVVEARWLRERWFDTPEWSEVRADPATERQLARWLGEVLTSP
ncbi:MAG: hypothetical protein H6838_19150 [Planctomycetes bacterium]|nr:hypothetical protein [Planctomycetota bacterium]